MPTTLEQPAPTFQDVWRMFQETDRLLKERSLETDRKFQETERLMKEQSAETERLMKEQSTETNRKIKQLSTEIGNLGNRLGDFVQGIVKPGLEELFQQRGLTVHRTMQNLSVAQSLATNLPALSALRQQLRERMRASPLCNGARFAESFSSVLSSVLGQ